MEKLDINTIKHEIIYGVNRNWPDIYKVRYAYLMLGKYLSKDTDFFFSTENKLDELNLSVKEIKQRYNLREGKNNYVTCLSASHILHEILYALNITSYLVKSKNNVIKVDINGEKFDIAHYILAVEADDKKYFVSLSADLPYIQTNMKTHHFGVNIPYIKTLSNGSKEQVYEGEEIKHNVLSEDELREIDIEIGYLKSFYNLDNNGNPTKDARLQYEDSSFDILRKELAGNKLFYNYISQKSRFYQNTYYIKNIGDQEVTLSDLDKIGVSDDDIKYKILEICREIDDTLNNITTLISHSVALNDKMFDFDTWLKEKCELLKEYILGDKVDDEEYKIDDNFDYTAWSRKIRKNKIYNDYEYDNVLSILDKTYALVKQIENKNPNNIITLLTKLSFHTLNSKAILPGNKNDFITNYYIANKLYILFPYIFSSNEIITNFNDENYSEKIVIIKKIIEMMFSELNINNSRIDGYNDNYNAVFNRIQLYAIKNTKDLSYQIVINVVGDNDRGDYYFLYNPKANTFRYLNFLDILSKDYIIVSDRLKERISNFNDNNVKKR